jgi:hypothetical protein
MDGDDERCNSWALQWFSLPFGFLDYLIFDGLDASTQDP